MNNVTKFGGLQSNKKMYSRLVVLSRLPEHKPTGRMYIHVVIMLVWCWQELPDAPLFYLLDKMAGFLHCVTPGMLSFRWLVFYQFVLLYFIFAIVSRSALLDLGYDVSFSHCQKQAVKTNAPPHVLWDIMRCWVSHYNTVDTHCITRLRGIFYQMTEWAFIWLGQQFFSVSSCPTNPFLREMWNFSGHCACTTLLFSSTYRWQHGVLSVWRSKVFWNQGNKSVLSHQCHHWSLLKVYLCMFQLF